MDVLPGKTKMMLVEVKEKRWRVENTNELMVKVINRGAIKPLRDELIR